MQKILGIGIAIGLVTVSLYLLFFQADTPQVTDEGVWETSAWDNVEKVLKEENKVIPAAVGFKREEVLPFDKLLVGSVSVEARSVFDVVYLDDYLLMPCQTDEGETNVLNLTVRSVLGDDELYTYTPAMETVATWEPYLLNDIGYLIYPSKTFAEQTLSFRDGGEYRSAGIDGSNENQMFIGWSNNMVFYASSQSCIDEAIETIYHTESH